MIYSKLTKAIVILGFAIALVYFVGKHWPPWSSAILDSSTEAAPEVSLQASSEIMNAILHSDKSEVVASDLEILQTCLHDAGKGMEAIPTFFMMTLLPQIQRGQNIYFVRPVLKPYCQAFYGAHLFRYWLVAKVEGKYDVRYAGADDEVRVMSSRHDQNYDIETMDCTANSCASLKKQFDGQRYVPTSP